MLYFKVDVMGVGLGAKLNFFQDGNGLILLGLLGLFLLFILKLTVVQNLTNGRIRGGATSAKSSP